MVDFLTAVRDYLAYVNAPDRAAESDAVKTVALIGLLDQLTTHIRLTNEGPPDVDEPVREEVYKDVYVRLSRHFSGYGWYPSVLDLDLSQPEGKIGAGDAIDDLADIAIDLQEVQRINEIAGPEAARKAFEFTYHIHWGRHLRELQLYLHRHLTGT